MIYTLQIDRFLKYLKFKEFMASYMAMYDGNFLKIRHALV